MAAIAPRTAITENEPLVGNYFVAANADTFERYAGLLAENHLPLRRAFKLLPEHKLRREVILHLKTGQLDAAYFRRKFGVELLDHFEPQFEQLSQHALIQIEGDEIRHTRDALLRVDSLLSMFYLPEHVGLRYT
jgi:oxygen-independent coproporphyrinogen-3 oxidase